MQLCDKSIYKALNNGNLVIIGLNDEYPFVPERQVQPASIDLRLGNRIVRFSDKGPKQIDIKDVEQIQKYAKEEYIEDGQGIVIGANEIVYGQVYEHISIGEKFSAKIEGRSRVARLGLSVHCTGDYINPGFIGAMPLQIFNYNKFSIKLYPYIGICQMILFKLTSKPLISYKDQTDLQNNRYYKEEVPSGSVISSDPLDGIKTKHSIISEKIDLIIEEYNRNIKNGNKKNSDKTISKEKKKKLIKNYYEINIKENKTMNQTNIAEQVGMQGNNSVDHVEISFKKTESDETEFQKMFKEIEQLRCHIKNSDDYSSDDTDIILGELAQIKKAIKSKDEKKILSLLKESGKKIYEIAKSIGCSLFANFISSKLGL